MPGKGVINIFGTFSSSVPSVAKTEFKHSDPMIPTNSLKSSLFGLRKTTNYLCLASCMATIIMSSSLKRMTT